MYEYQVYFLQGEITRFIKIGYAKDLERRLKECQSGSPDKLAVIHSITVRNEYEARKLEREFHELFEPLRKHGEWFEPSIYLLKWLEKLKTETDETRQAERKRRLSQTPRDITARFSPDGIDNF